MVPSRQLDVPFYKGIGRKRRLGFGALAQVIGRTAIRFLRKYIVPAAKRVGTHLLDIAVAEIADAVSGRKKLKTAAKNVGRQILRQQLDSGSKKRNVSRVNAT